MPVTCEMQAQASTAAVLMTSLRESIAVAVSVSESMRRPMVRLNTAIQSFTTMESASTATSAPENSVGVGAMIFWMDESVRLMPMVSTSAATTRPARYS